MEIFFTKSFVRDFQKLPKNVKEKASHICLVRFPELKSMAEFKERPFKKMRGFKFYYRIKLGDYRIGLKKVGHKIYFMRICHRKDIYRRFPR